MAKKITQEVEQTEVVETVQELTHTALSIVKDGQKQSLIRIKYNPTTGDVGSVEVIQESETIGEIQNAFRVAAAKGIF